MARIVRFEGVTRRFPDDATDAEIAAALGGAPADATGGQKPAPNRNRDWAVTLAKAPEYLGGAAGSFVGNRLGGPGGGMVGAYVGGAAGAPFHQAFNTLLGEPSPTPFSLASLRDINAAGNEQMSAEAGGQVAAKVIRTLGRGFVRGSIPDATGIEETFGVPDIVTVLERERIGAGKGTVEATVGGGAGRAGSEVAKQRVFDSAKQLETLLEEADRNGVLLFPKDIVSRAWQYARQLRMNTDDPAAAEVVRGLIKKFLKANRGKTVIQREGMQGYSTADLSKIGIGQQGNFRYVTDPMTGMPKAIAEGLPEPIPPVEPSREVVRWQRPLPASRAGQIERDAAGKAAAIYEAKRAGTYVPHGAKVEARYHKAVADEIRQQLEEAVPGFAKINRTTREAIAMEFALKQSETYRSGASLSWIPGLGKMMTPAVVRSRPFVNRAGMSLTNPTILDFLANAPRGANVGLDFLLGTNRLYNNEGGTR